MAIVAVLPVAFACSFFAPSFGEYAQEKPALGGSGGDAPTGAGGTHLGDMAGGAPVAGGAAGKPAAGGTSTAGAADEQAGASGAPPEGTALSFSGSELVRVGPAPTGDLTIELWLKTTMFGPGGQWFEGAALFGADAAGVANDFGASLVGNYFAFGTGNPDITAISLTPVNSGAWTHVAATREMATGVVNVYVNGNFEATVTTGNTMPLVDALPPGIGGVYKTYFYAGFVGTIDEVRMWSVVRSNADIASNMHTRLRGDEPGLAGYWRFDDDAGLVAKDSSTNGNDGTLGDGHPQLVPQWVSYSPAVVP